MPEGSALNPNECQRVRHSIQMSVRGFGTGLRLLGVARGGCNTFAALREVVAILLRGGLAIGLPRGILIARGCRNGIAALRRNPAMVWVALQGGLAMGSFLRFHK